VADGDAQLSISRWAEAVNQDSHWLIIDRNGQIAMSTSSPPRVQFVISAKFIALLLVAAGLLGGGYYWYSQQQEIQKRFHAPPYFVNRGPAVFRLCQHCLDLDKLNPKTEWNVGAPVEIPATEQRWFLAVEDPPLPVEVAGVLMLPVYPAQGDNPTLGFDRARVLLVLFQSGNARNSVESRDSRVTHSTTPFFV